MKTLTLTRHDVNPPSNDGRYARVLHCSESLYTGYKRYMDWRGFAGKGDPSVFKYIQKVSNVLSMTREIQEWIFGLIVESAEGTMTDAQLITAWTSLTANARAFNDGGGRDQGYADYILGVNTHKEPMKAQPVMCTGATLKLRGEPYWGRENHAPMLFQDFYIADMTDPATLDLTWADDWMYIMAATNSLNLADGGERIDPFPKMVGDRDTPWPLMGWGTTTGTIQAAWLKLLPEPVLKPAYPYMPYRVRGCVDRWQL